MIYKKFKDKKLSLLGMGTMRLPVIDGNDGQIDERKASDMVRYAIENGVNYFDTAWGYHGGQSELVMGRILETYPRNKFSLATKFPGYDLSNMDKVESIFEEQLKKCRVEYFDFYLFHNVCEINIDAYLNEEYGILEYLLEQKKNGRIKHIGFSAHGSYEVIKRFLEAYGEHMEFGQLQLNYVDWAFQDAEAKVELLNQYEIPVWVMEPFRGGKLASLSAEDSEQLRTLRPEETVAAWAFRFLQTLPQVHIILSGASTLDQMKENVASFSNNKPLDEAELKTLSSIAGEMVSRIAVPCTACGYCLSHCPQQLNIPALIGHYNEHFFTGGGFIAPMALMAIPEDKKPSACLGCAECEAVCPQQLKISEIMRKSQEIRFGF